MDEHNDDPLKDPQKVAAGTLITLMRIYDVLMAQLLLTNEEVYIKTYELHARGGLMAPLPNFNPEELL